MINTEYKDIDLTTYNNFLNECLSKDYSNFKCHKHHILPKFMGGSNSEDNLIRISREDHYIAHIILADCFNVTTHEYTGNILGAHKILKCMNDNIIIERNHPSIKQIMSKETIQKMIDSKLKSGSIIIKNGKYTFSDDVKKKMSEANKNAIKEGRRVNIFQQPTEYFIQRVKETRRKPGEFKHTEESKRKTSKAMKGKNIGSANGMYGKKVSEEQCKKISDRMKESTKGGKNNMAKRTKCNTTGLIFECAKDASKYFNITYDQLFYRMKKGLFSYV